MPPNNFEPFSFLADAQAEPALRKRYEEFFSGLRETAKVASLAALGAGDTLRSDGPAMKNAVAFRGGPGGSDFYRYEFDPKNPKSAGEFRIRLNKEQFLDRLAGAAYNMPYAAFLDSAKRTAIKAGKERLLDEALKSQDRALEKLFGPDGHKEWNGIFRFLQSADGPFVDIQVKGKHDPAAEKFVREIAYTALGWATAKRDDPKFRFPGEAVRSAMTTPLKFGPS